MCFSGKQLKNGCGNLTYFTVSSADIPSGSLTLVRMTDTLLCCFDMNLLHPLPAFMIAVITV